MSLVYLGNEFREVGGLDVCFHEVWGLFHGVS